MAPNSVPAEWQFHLQLFICQLTTELMERHWRYSHAPGCLWQSRRQNHYSDSYPNACAILPPKQHEQQKPSEGVCYPHLLAISSLIKLAEISRYFQSYQSKIRQPVFCCDPCTRHTRRWLWKMRHWKKVRQEHPINEIWSHVHKSNPVTNKLPVDGTWGKGRDSAAPEKHAANCSFF